MYVNMFTTAGLRERNEDTIYPEPGQPTGELFLVADGLGGLADGKIASAMACQIARDLIEREDPASFVFGGTAMSESELMLAFLSDVVRQAGAAVWHDARQRATDMGSTLLIVLIKNGRGYAAHVGDCALFVSESGRLPLVKLTTEHRRGTGLTRSLGAQEQVTPDVLEFAFGSNAVLVMGCDGFWEHVPGDQLAHYLAETPVFSIAEELVQAALAAGSQDNVSVIVLEGDAFVQQRAARQLEVYAVRLTAQQDTPERQARSQQLLEFAVLHASRGVTGQQIIADLLKRFPDSKGIWSAIRDRVPSEARDAVERLLPDFHEKSELETPSSTPMGRFPQSSAHPEMISSVTVGSPRQVTEPLQHVVDLLDRRDYRNAFSALDDALARRPEVRSVAEDRLKAVRTRMMERSWQPGDENFYERYLAFVPDDAAVRHLFGIRLWQAGNPELGWNHLKRLYRDNPTWQEQVVTFLKSLGGSVPTPILGDFATRAVEVGGCGATWGLLELAHIDKSSETYVRHALERMTATAVNPSEREAAIEALRRRSTMPSDASAPGTSARLDAAEDVELVRAELQRKLEAERKKAREMQSQIADLQDDLEKMRAALDSYRSFARQLSQYFLHFWNNYPRECERLFTSETLVKIKQFLTSEGLTRGVRIAPNDEQSAEGKKSFLDRLKK